jgi:hypothetical protein
MAMKSATASGVRRSWWQGRFFWSRAAAALLLLLAAAFPAARLVAEGAPAEATLVEGKAERKSGEKTGPLQQGSHVSAGDLLTTGEDGRVELRFADKSLLRIGPSAKLQLTAAHFSGGPAKRKMTVQLFFGNIWAKVTSIVSGEQRFQVETENAVAGVRGTTFRVDAKSDKSVLVRVYAGAVAVAKPIYASSRKEERHEVAGPEEVSRDKWEHLVGAQMQIAIAADGTPGQPQAFTPEDEKDDSWAKWNQERDEKVK